MPARSALQAFLQVFVEVANEQLGHGGDDSTLSTKPSISLPGPLSASTSPAIPRLLLATTAASLAGLAVCAAGWWLARRYPVIENLSAEQRQALVETLVAESPGLYRWAYFEPRLGYTLRPNAALRAWGDTFTSNELGYRTGPVAKPPNTLRVLFIGDSWTYGMGIQRPETFAEVFAELASAHSGETRKVESWVLALPGYNFMNEIAGLWFFYGRLQPDVVVLCPAGNDNHSTLAVLPHGATTEQGVTMDDFGDPHVVAYHMRRLESYRYQERWRRSFAAARDTEERLRRLGVPFFVFFVGRWHEEDAHAMMAGSGVESPYVVVPIELTRGKWSAQSHGHGNPAANRLYARMLYRAVAQSLGWPALPPGDALADVPVHSGPPAGTDWIARYQQLVDEESAAVIPESFAPPIRAGRQAVGPFEPRTGVLGRATTILVRRAPGAKRVSITVRRLEDAPYLYPLALTVSIPSPGGGTRTVVTVPADGPDALTFPLDIPSDLPDRAVLDVVFVADRVTSAKETLAGRSLYIAEIRAGV